MDVAPFPRRHCIGIAATAWLIGVCALVCDHFQPSPLLSGVMHTFVAVVTCCAICLVLIPGARALAGTSSLELYQFTRLTSRWVYLLLYSLAVIRVLLYLYEANQYCGSCGAPSTGAARSLEDFQFYVAACVVPLWVVRAVVLAVPVRSGT